MLEFILILTKVIIKFLKDITPAYIKDNPKLFPFF